MNTWKQNKRWAAAIFPPVWKLMFELLRFMSYLWTELKCDEGRRLKQTLITCWGFVCIAFCNTWFSISNNHCTHWPLTANQIFPSPLLLLPIQFPQSGCSTPLFVAMWNFNFIYHKSILALLHSFIAIVVDCEWITLNLNGIAGGVFSSAVLRWSFGRLWIVSCQKVG